MANQINSEDWNIDKFSSVVFPATTPVKIYRNHLSSFNIQNIQTSTYGSSYLASEKGFGDQYEVIVRALQDPGNLEFFVVEGGWVEEIQSIRQNQLGSNTFGPPVLRAVDTNNQGGYSDEFGGDNTGYYEYSREALANGSVRSFVIDGYPGASTPAIGSQGTSNQTPSPTFEVYNNITRQVDITQLDSIGIASRLIASQQRKAQVNFTTKNRSQTWEAQSEVDFYLGGTINSRSGVDFNQSNFGPSVLQAVDVRNIGGYCDEFGREITGLNQYPIGFSTDIRGSIIAQQAGFGIGTGIDFKVPTRDNNGQVTLQDSQLDQIGKERRKQEFLNRLKANATSETLGKINLDPFGLLAGQDLIIKDYRITKPKTLLGEIVQLGSRDLVGFGQITSIIPDDIYPEYGNGDKTSENLLDYTGAGQKAVLYNNLLKNKYGPEFEDSNRSGVAGLLDKVGGPGDPPQKQGYLDYVGNSSTERDTSLVDKVNDKTSGFIDSLFNQSKIGKDKDGFPTEGDKPSVLTTDPTKVDTYELGFDILPSTLETEQGIDTYKIGNVSQSSKRFNILDTYHQVDRWLPTENNELYWDADRTEPNAKRGLLSYTQKILKDREGGARYIGQPNTKSNQTVDGLHQNFSMGNLVKENQGDISDGYCRSWSVRRAYTSYPDLIRHGGLLAPKGGIDSKKQKEYSVLKDPGLVKIAWETGGGKGDFESRVLGRIKDKNVAHGVASQYMLSLENLAWKDSPHFERLPPCEVGPNGGRIMWFPPYDIDFTDNTSTSWDTTTFIGRGEPIYTYNHTERTGTLDFTILMDHSSLMNTFGDDGVDEIDRFLWGCSDLDDSILDKFLSPSEIKEIEELKTKDTDIIEEIIPPTPSTPPFEEVIVYFPNSRVDCQCGKPNVGQVVCATRTTNCIGRDVDFNWDLNEGLESKLNTLVEFLTGKGTYEGDDSGKYYQIQLIGHASKKGKKDYNKKLSFDRALNVRDYLFNLMADLESDGTVKSSLNDQISHKPEKDLKNSYKITVDNGLASLTSLGEENRWKIRGKGQDEADDSEDGENDVFEQGSDTDPLQKDARKVQIIIKPKAGFTTTDIDNKQKGLVPKLPDVNKLNTIKQISKSVNKRLISECDIFEKIEKEDPFIYKSIKDKLKHFHPAFHSLTPEMFNSRLTFLQQCMRQGPSLNGEISTQNLAFGRPPICILRIGDFYHTKVVIDSLNISYQNNSGVQWDLNPEGSGVQPMYAKVSLNFKFIGGSSLGGPIKQLQNAVSFNFFANTSLYNPLQIFESTDPKFGERKFYYGAYGSPEEENNPQEFFDNQFTDTENVNLISTTEEILGSKSTTLTPEQQKTIEEGYDGGDNNNVHTISVSISNIKNTTIKDQEVDLIVTSNTGEIGFLDLDGIDGGNGNVMSIKSVDILDEGGSSITESFPYQNGAPYLDSKNVSWLDLECTNDSKCLSLKKGFDTSRFYIKSKSIKLKIKLFNPNIENNALICNDGTCLPSTPDKGIEFKIKSERYQNLDKFQVNDEEDKLLVSNTYNLTVIFECGCLKKIESRPVTQLTPSVVNRELKLNKRVTTVLGG